MKQVAEVTALLDGGEKAEVLIRKHSACGDCGGCEGIKDRDMIVDNPLRAKVGNQVYLELAEKNILTAAVLIYLLPIVGLIAGYLIGEALGVDSEGLKAFMGFVLFFLSFLIARLYGRSREEDYEFQMIEVIE
ncbi:SoxR reducing system RseC family protein [Halonatronum saccharophilum]|uniref:SoxR reducing system RseC family protein n=1 Tax=Halonatronum saccharophilum TaxID=150060 RepID=UPI0004B51D53|nr:SoxR reducing system RseC family protein [Halonatronum saccharophilum]